MTVIAQGEVELAYKIANNAQRQAEDKVTKGAKSIADKATKILGTIGLGLGAVEIFKGAFSEAEEAQKVMAQTAQVIKTTGGVAGISAGQVSKLSEAISKKVGIDDEAIQSGANLLLTFTNIRNEAGKGNDVFNQATQIITDMSAALGQDLKSSAIQVGKALQDPVRGVTALRKVGVNFSDSQRQVIKSLVDTGHTLDAQKMILKELNTEFGGSAAAQATFGDKLKVVYLNLEESLGKRLMPAMEAIASVATRVLPVAFSVLGSAVGGVITAVGAVARFLDRNREVAVGLAAVLTTALIPAFVKMMASAGATILGKAVAAWGALAGAVQSVGVAFGVTGGAASLLTGAGILAGVGLLAGLVFKLGQSAKTTQDQIDKTTGALITLSKTSEVSQFINTSGVNLEKFKQRFAEFQKGIYDFAHGGATKAQLGNILDPIDKSLSSMVKSGNLDLASQSFQRITTYLGLTKQNLKDNPKLFDDYTKALKANSSAASENAANQMAAAEAGGTVDKHLVSLSKITGYTTDQIQLMADKLGVDFTKDAEGASASILGLAGKLQYTSANAEGYNLALQTLRDTTADAAEKTNAFKQALDALLGKTTQTEAIINTQKSITALTTAVKDNAGGFTKQGLAFDLTKEKGQNLAQAFDDLYAKSTNQIEIDQAQGVSKEQLIKTFDENRAAALRQAEALGLNKNQAQALLDKYGLFNKTKFVATLNANTSPARTALSKFVTDLNTVILNIAQNPFLLGLGPTTANALQSAKGQLIHRIQGNKRDPVVKDKGGWIPGPVNQPVPMIGHGGEFVLSRKMLASVGNSSSSGIPSIGRSTTVNVYPQIAQIDEREMARVLRNMELAGS